MPPEQVRGDKRIDQRADIYALGVILYECITGRRPYEAETLAHLAVLIHEGRAAPVTELCPDVPPAFAELVHRAMANKPELRFTTAREFGDALANFTGLVTGPTVGWPGRGARPPDLAPVKPPAGPSHGAAVSISQEWQPPRRSMFPLVLAGVGAIALIGAGIVFGVLPGRRSPAPEAMPSAASTSNVESTRATGSSGAAPAIDTAPAASAITGTEPTSTADAAAPTVATAKPPLRETPGISTSESAKGNAKSRADERGLVKDNPFK
jgi:serine/threonine-protein kinase